MGVGTTRSGRSVAVSVAAATALASVVLPPGSAAAKALPEVRGGTGEYVLTATDRGADYAPTFTGNGYMAVRVPPAGQGYLDGTVPAQTEVAGFYAKTGDQVQQRVNVPTWSTFTFGTGGADFTAGAGTTGWRQQLDLHTGTITTTARWTAPGGHVTDLRYVVATDRARPNVGVVRLEVTPRWSGTATVTDLLDGTPADQSTGVAKGWDAGHRQVWETVRTNGLGVVAGLASTVDLGAAAHGAHVTPVAADKDQSAGQRMAFPVSAGSHYTLTKYVGVTTSHESARPDAAARAQSAGAARRGTTRSVGRTPRRGRRCGATGSTSSATTSSPPRSTRASSTCGPAPARASTGASRPRACRPTATAATSSGTPRRGCTPRCSPSTRTWPRA